MPAINRKNAKKKPVRKASQARSEATVNAIVQAATRILAEDGWQRVNTNAIARRAGVSVGSVYEYFTGKQDILDLIIDRHLTAAEALFAEFAGAMAGRTGADDVVHALISGFIRLHEDNPRLHRALSSEVPISPAQRSRIEALRSGIVALVAKALSEHTDDADLKAVILVNTTDALTHRWFVDRVGIVVSAEVMAAEATKMLKGYLSA